MLRVKLIKDLKDSGGLVKIEGVLQRDFFDQQNKKTSSDSLGIGGDAGKGANCARAKLGTKSARVESAPSKNVQVGSAQSKSAQIKNCQSGLNAGRGFRGRSSQQNIKRLRSSIRARTKHNI